MTVLSCLPFRHDAVQQLPSHCVKMMQPCCGGNAQVGCVGAVAAGVREVYTTWHTADQWWKHMRFVDTIESAT